MRTKVLTLNLWNDGQALDRRESLLNSGLQRLQPDVVCLQEVSRNPATKRIRSEVFAAACGLAHHLFSGFGEPASPTMEGLSILSRYPAPRLNTVTLPSFAGDYPRQAFLAELAIEGRRIAVATTHLAYPPMFSRERKVQTDRLLDSIDQFVSDGHIDAIILTGDFNDECSSPSIQAVMRSKHGFRDAYSTCHPNSPGVTFTSSNPYTDPGFEPGLRIDFIFATPSLRPVTCTPVFDGSHGNDLVSDHFGLMAEFEF
jgi:endonuclease/exonuclease/phosphatase family metal-dependent hydrolase